MSMNTNIPVAVFCNELRHLKTGMEDLTGRVDSVILYDDKQKRY